MSSIPVKYVNLGKSGLKVSQICLGTMTFGSKQWNEWVLEEEESRRVIKRALDLGINLFDTADVYSHGLSEEILGRALRAAHHRYESQRANWRWITRRRLKRRLQRSTT